MRSLEGCTFHKQPPPAPGGLGNAGLNEQKATPGRRLASPRLPPPTPGEHKNAGPGHEDLPGAAVRPGPGPPPSRPDHGKAAGGLHRAARSQAPAAPTTRSGNGPRVPPPLCCWAACRAQVTRPLRASVSPSGAERPPGGGGGRASGVIGPAAPPGAAPASGPSADNRADAARASVSPSEPARLRPRERAPTRRPGAGLTGRRGTISTEQQWQKYRPGCGDASAMATAASSAPPAPRAAPAAGRLLLPCRPTRPRTLTQSTQGTHGVGWRARGSEAGGARGRRRPGRRWSPRDKLGAGASRAGLRARGRSQAWALDGRGLGGGVKPPWQPG